MRTLLAAFVLVAISARSVAQVQPHGGMLRYPDVSADLIVFSYADDLWTVPRTGGVASPLASPPGIETFPRFSADGKTIAFVGSYSGGRDLYTIPVEGGVPTRVTYHPGVETLCDWTPDGKLLFFTNAFAGRDRMVQLFTVAPTGGAYTKLPVPYGAFGSISPSGEWLAYTPHTTDDRTWKRYQGGMATDVWLFHLANHTSKRVTDWPGTDTQPMWHKSQLYYLSDDGPTHRLNVWNYDPSSEKRKQLTHYADLDVKWPAIGPGPAGRGEIVFQHGAELVLLDLETEVATPVVVKVPGARPNLAAQRVDASKTIDSWNLSPTGKRAVVAARGDVWTLPAGEGSPRDVTRTSNVTERDPVWSPDGKTIAYFSDASGEYELWTIPADGGEARRLTKNGQAFRARPVWSPDGRFLAFTDKTGTLSVAAVASGDVQVVDHDPWIGELAPEDPSWSHDGRWLAYVRSDERSRQPAIWLYESETGDKHRVTSATFVDAHPTFDRKGDWLYFVTSRHFEPLYGDLDLSFVYPGTQVVAAVPLRADVKSPLLAKSDEEEGPPKKDDANEKDKPKPDEPRAKVEITLDDFESRAIQLPIEPGEIGALAVNDAGALLYTRGHPQGQHGETTLHVFDPAADEHEEKQLATDVEEFRVSADGKKVLVVHAKDAEIVDAKAPTDAEKPDHDKKKDVVTDAMDVDVDPRAEWSEIFTDAWRMMRDFFYDPGMHHVDWLKVRDAYAAMLPDCTSRGDLSYVIKEMISELNVGHAYYEERPIEGAKNDCGLLGCDFALESNAWRIGAIHEGAPWDLDARNPLRAPGVDVKRGEWLLAVNGTPLDPGKDPWAALQGTAGRAIVLTVSSKPVLDASARKVVVEALASEHDLRYREWIEKNRAYVEKKSDGRIGYVYVPSTGIDGQSDLVRQYYSQIGRAALLVDERWNSGGQIPNRFVELLDRPVTNYWARRDAADWVWPPDAHHGPKAMLVNGLSGSGGDAFPAYFRRAGLGKLIGTRTWGGLVGLSDYPRLLDGARVLCPSFAYYDTEGRWAIEGHGVDPDVEVVDDPALMQDGADPQLDAGIKVLLDELAAHPFTPPARPPYPDRSGMGLGNQR